MLKTNLSKKNSYINTSSAKGKRSADNLPSKPNKNKEDNELIFKDKSPNLYNRRDINNLNAKEAQKTNYNKFNVNNNNQKLNEIPNIINQENKKFDNTKIIKIANNNLYENNFKNINPQINLFENNNILNEFSLKKEIDLLKNELNLAHIKLKEKDKKIDFLENQLIKQKEENKNIKNENCDLKKKLEEKNSQNILEHEDNQEFPAFYRRRNMVSINDMLEDFVNKMHGYDNHQNNQDNIIDQLYPNPDNMTYEQLLELEEKMGYVSKGLIKEQKDKIPIKEFSKNKNKNHVTSCTICLVDFVEKEKLKLINCGHQFHSECLDEWLNNEKICPMCKMDIIIN